MPSLNPHKKIFLVSFARTCGTWSLFEDFIKRQGIQ
jgi:hypothetical protein